MASSLSLSPPSLSTPQHSLSRSRSPTTHRNTITLRFHLHRPPPPPTPLQASKRVSNFTRESSSSVDDRRNWSRNRSGVVVGEYDDDGDEDEDDDDEDEEDRSMDLLVRFVQNVFKKISRKARKAVRSVLPINISTKLVGFSVDGVVILAFLWILKAFLEVICTLGSVVFVSILLIRVIWAGISYLQEIQNKRTDELDDDRRAWSRAQPVT